MSEENILKATYGSKETPLVIGDIKIDCYVLEDGRRVLSGNGMTVALGMTIGNNQKPSNFIKRTWLNPYIPSDLAHAINNPIKFKRNHGGQAYGFEATLLPKICEAILKARRDGSLDEKQLTIAMQAEILMSAFATVGIIALIDEVTGYQEVRDKLALQEILDKYLKKEYAIWAKRFPDEFYKEMFRLKGWTWRGMSINRPSIVGKYTNDLVYERMTPGILEELQSRNPKDEKGVRKTRHHQWLTDDIGHPALSRHIYAIISFMRVSSTWDQFMNMVQRAFPKKNEQLPLGLEEIQK